MAKYTITLDFPNSKATKEDIETAVRDLFIHKMKSEGMDYKFTGLKVEEVKDVSTKA